MLPFLKMLIFQCIAFESGSHISLYEQYLIEDCTRNKYKNYDYLDKTFEENKYGAEPFINALFFFLTKPPPTTATILLLDVSVLSSIVLILLWFAVAFCVPCWTLSH